MDKVNELSKRQRYEEKIMIANVLDKFRYSSEYNRFQYMSFFDLSQQMKIELTLKLRNITNYELQGGYEGAERKMLMIYPQKHLDSVQNIEEYKKKQQDDVIGIVRIILPKEVHSVYEHRTYLGALMKMGIERRKIGDIIVREDGADIIICKDIEAYLKRSLKDLTRFQKAKIEFLNIDKLKYVKPVKEKIKINVTSMRLDCIVAELARCSRNEANKLLEQERVFVNFKEEIVPSKKVEENSYITVRGKGRFKILGICGTTRSGRLTVEVEK